jgi:hypothetical protein
VRPDDDELTLFWRGVKESAGVYADLMYKLAAGEELGVPQAGKGRLYQVRQRGMRHERKVERMLRDGMLDGLDLGVRIRWFAAE